MDFKRFDEFYATIAKETGGIEGLFHSLFDFLLRKTDFFYESDPGDKMGFPPGINTRIIFETFKKFQDEHYKKFPKKDQQDYQKKLKIFQEKIEQEKKELQKQQDESNQQKQQQQIITNKEQFQSNISNHNGGVTDKYIWSQSLNDVTVQVHLPKNTKAKDINVEIKMKNLYVCLKNQSEPLINGELYSKVKVDDSLWNIEDGSQLLLTLEKAQVQQKYIFIKYYQIFSNGTNKLLKENIWKTVIIGDEEIDTSKVDTSKKLQDFDPETQGALRKVMHEQERKLKGLPTTEEEAQHEMLKQAWNAEGSPFKGQPFDPSILQSGNNQMKF